MRTPKALLAAAAALAIAGCIDLDEEMVIANDGSGTVKARIVLSEETLRSIEALRKDEHKLAKDKNEFQARVKAAGCKVEDFKRETKDGKVTVTYALSFKDINLLISSDMNFFRGNEAFGTIKLTADAKGAITFERRLDLLEEHSHPPEETGIMAKAYWAAMKGLNLKFTLTLPNEVKETDGEKDKGNKTLTWGFDLAKTRKLAADKKSPVMTATFDGKGIKFKVPKGE